MAHRKLAGAMASQTLSGMSMAPVSPRPFSATSTGTTNLDRCLREDDVLMSGGEMSVVSRKPLPHWWPAHAEPLPGDG